ncbi:hypothetical protein FNV43_RR23794 [Rhamnella rubrinervis]|uniref:Agenet domain-containing protein n=1 Tax=Rhamnella rubrinervis TaxID=2594499 RepID=A0A8K0DKB7_9ROSA|nr:hypothetical protein FNV43_RR23794 [Rhamnella rubrinervis]
MADAIFDVGDEVEVAMTDQNKRTMMFPAIIFGKGSKDNAFLVEYKAVNANRNGRRSSGSKRKNNNGLLREEVDAMLLRPVPPQENDNLAFQFGDKVDVRSDEGWRYGVVVEVLKPSKFGVHFQFSKQYVEVELSELRLHRDWINGAWVPPLLLLEQDVLTAIREEIPSKKVNQSEWKIVEDVLTAIKEDNLSKKVELSEGTILEDVSVAVEEENGSKKVELTEGILVEDISAAIEEERPSKKMKLRKGTLVEVRSDEDGLKGAWFAAKIVEAVGKDKFLIQHKDLRTDDDREFLMEEVDLQNIRPDPPERVALDAFTVREKVEARYNDAWWEGEIHKVLRGGRYRVYFEGTEDQMDFGHDLLRPRQDWIDGEWVSASEGEVSNIVDTSSGN